MKTLIDFGTIDKPYNGSWKTEPKKLIMVFPYDKLSKHIFNWPNREECLREWYRVYSQSSFYAKGIELINDFFSKVLKSELNRLMSNL